MQLHQRLWEQNQDLAGACLAHPFVKGLRDGSLDPKIFGKYVGQDAFFLRAFLSAYALAAARCMDRLDHATVFHRLMGGVLEELTLHASYAASLGLDLEAVRPRPATVAYTDFLQRTAWSGGVGEIVAAMSPCMRLYAFLGEELAPPESQNPYRDWIETYSSEEFGKLAAELEALLDELGEDTAAVRGAYRYAMVCELDFFGAGF
jgi:thiaminase/transcriptional activator TenA